MAYFDLSGGGGSTPPTGKYTATTRDANIDMGANSNNRYLDTTGVPNSNTGTYTPTTRAASIDMGATNAYRYVNTNSVPNTNSGTYTFPANDTGGQKDLGATNTYRYVNATNVYAKGKADGATSLTAKLLMYGEDWGYPSRKQLKDSSAHKYLICVAGKDDNSWITTSGTGTVLVNRKETAPNNPTTSIAIVKNAAANFTFQVNGRYMVYALD